MSTLLEILVSPRGEHSTSRKLTAHFVEQWKKANPQGTVITRDLMKTILPYVDLPWIGGAFTPPETHSPESAAAIKISNDLVAELQAADRIVIGTPMYNFSIPAALKSYIDHVVRLGLTFNAANEGLLKGKSADIILASGGDYSPGSPTEGYNLASGYLRQVLSHIGITDVNVTLAGAPKAGPQGENALENFAATVAEAVGRRVASPPPGA